MGDSENTTQALLNTVACWETDPGFGSARDFFFLFTCVGGGYKLPLLNRISRALWSDRVGGRGGGLLHTNWVFAAGSAAQRDTADFDFAQGLQAWLKMGQSVRPSMLCLRAYLVL